MSASSKTITLIDVARLAGVSTATVSRVLNNPGKVGKETRQRVHAAVDALGYTPNFGGRMLAVGRSNTIGAVIPTLANAIFSVGLQAFQEELAQAGKTLLVASTDYNPENELAQIRTLIARGAEGLLLTGTHRLSQTWDFLVRRRVPHVITWAYGSEAERVYVGFDNTRAATEMTRQVLDMGHRDLAMISGISAHNDRVRDRQAGIRQAVAACAGARLLHEVETAYDPAASAQAFRRIMADPCPPTVIICGNDVQAAGALLAARQMEISVPGMVSITGFDDIELASLVYPPLTTVRVPQVRMGQAAAQLLLALLAEKAEHRSVLLEAKVILRASLGPPRIMGERAKIV